MQQNAAVKPATLNSRALIHVNLSKHQVLWMERMSATKCDTNKEMQSNKQRNNRAVMIYKL